MESTIVRIVDGARGIYLPKSFIDCFDWQAWGIKEVDADILKNPGHDDYWEAWDDVLNYAKYNGDSGHTWTLYQDSDLFAVRDDHNFDD